MTLPLEAFSFLLLKNVKRSCWKANIPWSHAMVLQLIFSGIPMIRIRSLNQTESPPEDLTKSISMLSFLFWTKNLRISWSSLPANVMNTAHSARWLIAPNQIPLSFICVTEDMPLIMRLHMSLKVGSSLPQCQVMNSK